MEKGESLIESFLEEHQCLKALPESSIRILKLLQDPNFRMERLIKLIEQDAALSARIIKVVNSAAYARVNRITQLKRAAVYLGINTVKEIAVATTVSAVCKPVTIGKYAMRDLWDHSLGVAVLSREFALRSKVIDPELAFLSGILHDIGLLLSAQSEVETSEEIFIDAEDRKIPFREVEQNYFGFDHCELGVRLASAWTFPEEVSAVINWHHSPQNAPENFKQICTHVYIADTLCTEAGVGFPLTCALQKADDKSLDEACLGQQDIDAVISRFKVLLRLHQD